MIGSVGQMEARDLSLHLILASATWEGRGAGLLQEWMVVLGVYLRHLQRASQGSCTWYLRRDASSLDTWSVYHSTRGTYTKSYFNI